MRYHYTTHSGWTVRDDSGQEIRDVRCIDTDAMVIERLSRKDGRILIDEAAGVVLTVTHRLIAVREEPGKTIRVQIGVRVVGGS